MVQMEREILVQKITWIRDKKQGIGINCGGPEELISQMYGFYDVTRDACVIFYILHAMSVIFFIAIIGLSKEGGVISWFK